MYLLRHHYTDHTLHCMVRAILKESSHRDAAPNLVWEDMSVNHSVLFIVYLCVL